MNFQRIPLFAFLSLTIAIAGCSSQKKLENHLASAKSYFEAGDFESALIEYQNVLEIDPLSVEAMGNVGVIYFRQGLIRQAHPILVIVKDMAPENLTYRGALGELLVEGGSFADAWSEAEFILNADANNEVAPSILQRAAVRLGKIAEARATLESLRETNQTAPILAALGMLEVVEGNLDQAEVYIDSAIKRDASSSISLSAKGSLYWAKGDLETADEALLKASAQDSENLYQKLRYAYFKTNTRDHSSARKILDEILENASSFVPALILKANIALAERQYEEANSLTERLLKITPDNLEAIIVDAKVKVANGDTEKAINRLSRSIELNEGLSEVSVLHYQLALAYLAANQPLKANINLTKTLSIDPNHREAKLIRASLTAKEGDPDNAMLTIGELIDENPNNDQAKLLLAQINIQAGQLEKALDIYRDLSKKLRTNPEPPRLEADVLLQMGRNDEARKKLEVSLARSTQYLPTYERLTDLDIYEKRFEEALARIEAPLVNYDDVPSLHFLKGKILIASDRYDEGLASLNRSIELNPKLRPPYLLKANYFSNTGQIDAAQETLDDLLIINPKDVGALSQLGSLFERQKDFSNAYTTYERILEIDSNHAGALNNLAYFSAEHTGELDKALELALKARDLLPKNPLIADTLGWIYYRKGDYDAALELIQEGEKGIGAHPDSQYHLAKVQYARGSIGRAEAAFRKALELGLDGEKAEDARKIVESL